VTDHPPSSPVDVLKMEGLWGAESKVIGLSRDAALAPENRLCAIVCLIPAPIGRRSRGPIPGRRSRSLVFREPLISVAPRLSF